MYEGKNIHYSQTDQKPLCSFSGKVCNQRRLNNYGFCVRHILEDPSAPFKRCAYVAKSSRQTCTQPIPKSEEREYCNNHMQVLGMLPKKERKVKKAGVASLPGPHMGGAMSDPGLLQNKLKPRQGMATPLKARLSGHKITAGKEDMDDVYAFPTENDKHNKEFTALVSSSASVSIVGLGSPTSYGAINRASNDSSSGQSSLAKIYPELAEKLEKIKPKIETKVKGKVKSSRTMNSLQTKIAQNKIKDKLKRNQSSSNASSQSQSPSHSFLSNSPGYHINTCSPNHVVQHSVPQNVTVNDNAVHDGKTPSNKSSITVSSNETNIPSSLPGHSSLNILNGLNLQSLNQSLEQLGLPVPTVSDIEQTLKQLAKAANISLEESNLKEEKTPTGLSTLYQRQSVTQPVMVPVQTFPPLSGPPPPYPGPQHRPTVTVMHPAGSSVTSSPVKADPAIGHQSMPLSSSNSASTVVTVPLISRQLFSSTVPSVTNTCISVPTLTSALSAPSISSLSSSFPAFPNAVHPKLTLLTTTPSAASPSVKVQDKVTTDSVKQPPAPSLPQPVKQKASKAKPRSRTTSTATVTAKRSVPLFTLPMTMVQPRKMRKVLDVTGKKVLKTKSAMDLYEKNLKRKMNHHYMIYTGIVSSDESDISDCDMLPWQSDWLTPSSDEDVADDEDNDYTLRTAKLALGRARQRRQCFQARRSNLAQMDSTLSLIIAARDSSRSAVKSLDEVLTGKRRKSANRSKHSGIQKRRCLYRDNDDVQCKNIIVPYTNHCSKHVMYNVDQQLFEYCTAKFADNTQCCRPVIDVKHELPLCIEHGRKADNFLKSQDSEPKPKKPRKKTKPSALTRPPKKGKKKKNQRKTTASQQDQDVQIEDTAPDTDVVESSEDTHSQQGSEVKTESDSERPEPEVSSTPEITCKPTMPAVVAKVKVEDRNGPRVGPGAGLGVGPVVSDGGRKEVPLSKKETMMVVSDAVKSKSASSLEELDNLHGLELENVRMFGELETASKLLEENDFQDVFNKLPDEAFDIFSSKASGLPSSEDLQAFEDSLALANRELNSHRKDAHASVAAPPRNQASKPPQLRYAGGPVLEEADDITRQIAEEVLKQNIGPSANIGRSLCNGDAEESIKAIARSLSNSGMMLAPEATGKQKIQNQNILALASPAFTVSASLNRSSALPAYSTFEYFPPNMAVQNIAVTSGFNVNSSVASVSEGLILAKPKEPLTQVFSGPAQPSVIPQNVTVTPRGIITSHIPATSSSSRAGTLIPLAQTVTIGNTTVTGNQTAGIITLPGSQQLTAQQLSALVQQAAAHLPPLPPYKPRQSTVPAMSSTGPASTVVFATSAPKPVLTPGVASKTTGVATNILPAPSLAVGSAVIGPRAVAQDLVLQHLTQRQQQEQMGQQQQVLAQQILQQRLAVFAQGAVRVTVPSSQNLGFTTILQQGTMGQLSQLGPGIVQAMPNMSHLIKTNFSTSQPPPSAHVTLPTTNIVWTSPPNVTITTPNGLPQPLVKTKTTHAKLPVTFASTATQALPVKETFIDLTDSDPPSYEASQSALSKSQPPPSYPTHSAAVNSVSGKS